MARLQEDRYPVIGSADLKAPIVFVVDMVNGFIKEGALHDEAIAGIVTTIRDVLVQTDCKNVFVCDSHPPKTREFQSFPSHCRIGHSESEIVDELLPYAKYKIRKNSTNAFVAPEFQELLPTLDGYEEIIITGCCTDLCILQFALCLNSWLNEHNKKQRLIVLANAVETYHSNLHDAYFWNDAALKNMAANGIEVFNWE